MPAPVKQLNFPQKLLIAFGTLLFRLLSSTIRVRITPEAAAILSENPRSDLFLLWHNRLALALIGLRKVHGNLPLTGLVSTSKDGAILAQIMHAFGIKTARGSSSRRAVEATRELLEHLKAGQNIVITPDGPRGPLYVIKSGTALLAQNYVKATLLLGLTASRSWQFNSWDKFILPKPFSTVTITIEKASSLQKEDLQRELLKINRV